ncbi:MAG: methyl-accepting chemotaxis protein [Spirochaetes bacterium]|nr:methyl-accepting chemotaxis protein [Spirochaetota bacterium]
MKRHAVPLFALFCLAAVAALHAAPGNEPGVSSGSAPDGQGPRLMMAADDGWVFSVGDDPARSSPGFDDSSWIAAGIPSRIALGMPEGYWWLRAKLVVPPELRGKPVWFNTGKAWAAMEIYVNGVLIGLRGGMPPGYFMRPGLTNTALIPSSLVDGDGTVSLALRCYTKGTATFLPGFQLVNLEGADFLENVQNLFNGELYVVLAAICLFIGIYFIAQFVANPGEHAFLFFSFSLIFIALYFYDLGAARFVTTGLLLRAIARAALTLSMGFLILFFMRFFGICDNRILRGGIMAEMAVVFIAFILNAKGEAELNVVFNLSLLPVFAGILFGTFIVARAAMKGVPDALPIIVGLVVGIGFGIHDIIYQMIGVDPFAWLQGMSFFTLNLSVFVAMSWRTARFQKDLNRNTVEIQRQRDRLESLFGEIGRAVDETSEVAGKLESSVADVSNAAGRSANAGTSIGASVKRQNEALAEAREAVTGLLGSIEKVDAELESETVNLENGLEIVTGLLEGVGRMAGEIEKTAALSDALSLVGSQGEREVVELSSAIEKVRRGSSEIRGIVDAVNDFAEQTNLLAMNASIEAAHAGQFGRGFAVIAQEIKKLAAASANRACKIGEIMDSIDGLVGEATQASVRAAEALNHMAGETAGAALNIRTIVRDAESSRKQGAQAQAALNDIGSSASRVKSESARQGTYSSQVRGSMSTLFDCTGEVSGASDDIMKHDRNLVEQSSALQNLAAASRSIAGDLSALMKRE